MRKKLLKVITIVLVLSLFIMISIQNNLVNAENTFAQVVEGFDWGPCVTKMVIHLDTQITVFQKKES